MLQRSYTVFDILGGLYFSDIWNNGHIHRYAAMHIVRYVLKPQNMFHLSLQ